MQTAIIVLGIYFIFKKNILVRNYIFLGIIALVTSVLYYLSIFRDSKYWTISVAFTLALIGFIKQQWTKKNDKHN